jgi:hypothetical protein
MFNTDKHLAIFLLSHSNTHNITQVTVQPRNDIAAQNNSAAHTSAASGPWIPQFRLRAAERAAVLVLHMKEAIMDLPHL